MRRLILAAAVLVLALLALGLVYQRQRMVEAQRQVAEAARLSAVAQLHQR